MKFILLFNIFIRFFFFDFFAHDYSCWWSRWAMCSLRHVQLIRSEFSNHICVGCDVPEVIVLLSWNEKMHSMRCVKKKNNWMVSIPERAHAINPVRIINYELRRFRATTIIVCAPWRSEWWIIWKESCDNVRLVAKAKYLRNIWIIS